MSANPQQKKLIPEDALEVLRPKENEISPNLRVLPQQDHGIKIAFLTFFIVTGYATIRYNLLRGIAWSDWPVYTLNKIFGVTSLLLLVIAVARYRAGTTYPNGKIMYAAGLFGGIHILLSCFLLNPAYYEKFFHENKLTFTAGLSMLLATIAAVLFFNGAISRGERKVKDKMIGLVVIGLLTAFHTFFQGFNTWFEASAWPGFLPPITLLAFLAGFIALVIFLIPKRTLK